MVYSYNFHWPFATNNFFSFRRHFPQENVSVSSSKNTNQLVLFSLFFKNLVYDELQFTAAKHSQFFWYAVSTLTTRMSLVASNACLPMPTNLPVRNM